MSLPRFSPIVEDTLRQGLAVQTEVVYLLHFDAPYPAGRRPQHYIGHAERPRFERRMAEHAAGSNKARLTQVFAELGIGFTVARLWYGNFAFERELKRRHRPAALCPICKEAKSNA